MNRQTGRNIAPLAHLSQSVTDIITTRLGSRLMRRDYGSQLPDMLDHPFNDATRLRAYATITMALMRWEPRIRLSKINLNQGDSPGSAVLELHGSRLDNNQALSLSLPLALGGSA